MGTWPHLNARPRFVAMAGGGDLEAFRGSRYLVSKDAPRGDNGNRETTWGRRFNLQVRDLRLAFYHASWLDK
jgi:hypothetical protein